MGDAYNGAMELRTQWGTLLRIVFSNSEGWDHVSVSHANRTPSWNEMCYVKDWFFEEEDCVVQYHPPKRDYVNFHPFVLHLWRYQGSDFPRPPVNMIGPRTHARGGH